MKKDVFKMPKPVKITGRTSSITNAFVNGIIPVIEPESYEITDALETLGMTEDTICCAYCGDTYTEWDHFHPLIRNKRPTGYISEIHNLVPACGKCNQSKGNKEWKQWMLSDAKLSPHTRQIPDMEERIKKLDEYEKKYRPRLVDFEAIIGKEAWLQHWKNCETLHKMMYEYQDFSDKIKEKLYNSIKKDSDKTKSITRD